MLYYKKLSWNTCKYILSILTITSIEQIIDNTIIFLKWSSIIAYLCGGAAFLCLHTVHCSVCACAALPLSPSHAARWHNCMKDVLDRTDNTFLITEAISSNHNATGPAGELVCGLAVGSTCSPSLLKRNTICHVKISNLCNKQVTDVKFC